MDAVEVTDDNVRAARHGYYASLSYVDEKIAEVLAALAACGLDRDTVTIFTSDHGDFLGEHGLFYKMSFREHAARIPLVFHAPGRFRPRRVRQPASLLDLVPTLADLARPGLADELAVPVDGRSLAPLAEGAAEDSEAVVLGEYLAEGALAPMIMIRRGRWKFVHTRIDPDQLFDLDADPAELENRAPDAAHADVVRAFRDEVEARWDLEALERDVLRSQRARHVVFDALQRGRHFPWDFQPFRDASKQYTRSTMDVAARDRQARFPPLPREDAS
jgi:choline-sulfatase